MEINSDLRLLLKSSPITDASGVEHLGYRYLFVDKVVGGTYRVIFDPKSDMYIGKRRWNFHWDLMCLRICVSRLVSLTVLAEQPS